MKQLTGWWSSDLSPYLEISTPTGEPIDLMVDSGFNGEVTLPIPLIKKLKLKRRGRIRNELADGSMAWAKAYAGEILRGMVILTPVDQPTAPPVTIYITNASTDPMGQFTVSQTQGPVAGKYRVEVRQDAVRWMSNSRDPMMIKMMGKMRDRTLTDEDRKVWSDYVRKRDLSPSIENQRVYRRQRSQDKTDYVVEIKSGGETQLNLEVFSR